MRKTVNLRQSQREYSTDIDTRLQHNAPERHLQQDVVDGGTKFALLLRGVLVRVTLHALQISSTTLRFIMKKSIVVAACVSFCALSAQAQSSVQLMGLVDAYVGSMRMAGEATSVTKLNSGGMTTSWWGLGGSEDLGGGMKASFLLTSFFQTDSGATGRFGEQQFSRDANVSLSGGWGVVTLGRSKAPNFLPTILFNPFGDSYTFSPLVLHASVPLGPVTGRYWLGTVPADTGWSNQVTYSTPSVGGLKGNLHYQLGEIAGSSKHNVGLNVFYSAGPVGLTAFWERDQINNPFASAALPDTRTDWMLGGTYDAGVLKAFLTYGVASSDAAGVADRKTTSIGASAPMGGGKLLAGFASTKISGGAKRETMTVGYDYNLSKRTDVYAMLMQDKITALSSGTSYGVGVRHRF